MNEIYDDSIYIYICNEIILIFFFNYFFKYQYINNIFGCINLNTMLFKK